MSKGHRKHPTPPAPQVPVAEEQLRLEITGLIVQVEITGYNKAGQVAGRPKQPVQFTVLEASIPKNVLDWVRSNIPPLGGE